MDINNEKIKAREIIDEYNRAIQTCIQQENIVALDETLAIRNEKIREYFSIFSALINEQDKEYFNKLTKQDSSINDVLDEFKSNILSSSDKRKKEKKRITLYTKISKQK